MSHNCRSKTLILDLFPTVVFCPLIHTACLMLLIKTLHHQQYSLSSSIKSPNKVISLILSFFSHSSSKEFDMGWGLSPSIIFFFQINLIKFHSEWSTILDLNSRNYISWFYLHIYEPHSGIHADTRTKQMTPELAQSRPKLGVDICNSLAGC